MKMKKYIGIFLEEKLLQEMNKKRVLPSGEIISRSELIRRAIRKYINK